MIPIPLCSFYIYPLVFFFNNNITVADHLSPGERNSPLTQFIRSVGFFYYLYDTKFHVKTGSHTTTKYEANKISFVFWIQICLPLPP